MDPLLLRILASLAFGLAAALLVLVAYRVTGAGQADIHRFSGVSMRRAEMRRRALARSILWVFVLPLVSAVARLVERAGPEALRSYVRGPYARAGYPGGLDDDEVVALGFLMGVMFMVLIGFLATLTVGAGFTWMGLIGLPVGFLGLVSGLKSKAALRENDILRALPYVLDLIVLILRSGTTLGIALGRVVEDHKDHPIGDELGQVLAEMNMGAPRIEAFKSLAKRLNIPDINALADSIIQAEELGWPLAETLERLADRLANERVLRAQATAGAAGVWVMLPSTLVLMAAVLLLLGPIIVRLLRGGFSMHG